MTCCGPPILCHLKISLNVSTSALDLRIFLTSAKCPNLVKLLVSLLVCHFDCVLTDAEERSSDDVVMELETNEEELETNEEELETNEEELDNVFHICVSLPHSATNGATGP